ncbi:hypothetical protein KKH15_03070 [Patescibacteria group bacterium]|nr:hypothetical protein [Patescibacteria group bacterium]MBU1755264.1 hypothetical protein [Patescibacteria group bacterium]
MNVRVTLDVSQKYVVAYVEHEGMESALLWGNPSVQWHKDIVSEMKTLGYEVVSVAGGGWVHIVSNEKKIYFRGTSTRYGTASQEMTEELMRSAYPEFERIYE